MIPSVSVTLANGAIGGAINTADGVTGIVLTGAGTGTLALLTPVKVVSLDDAIAKGITLAVEPLAYQFCKEFYSVDGTLGVPVFIMLVANTASVTTLCDKTNTSGLKKLVDFAQGTIRVVAVLRKPAVGYVPAVVSFIDDDVVQALTNAKAFVADRFVRHQPLRIIIGARVHAENNATIFVPNTAAANGVAFALGSSEPDGLASLGLILGRVAAVPVHRNIGRNKDGALPANALYIGTKKVEDFAALDTLIDAGYITFTTYPQKAGYYISDDPMAVSQSDDYRTLANCRVIDKASIIAYQTYIEELKDDVALIEGGRLAPVEIKYLEGVIFNNISLAMSENISAVNVYIDHSQNLATGSKLKVDVRLRPKGYLKEILVELGFTQ